MRWLLPGLALAALLLGACSHAPQLGYEPPLSEAPFTAYTENWHALELFSGAFDARYTFSDGDSQGVRADMLVQPAHRAIIDLTYQTRSVAHIMIGDEVMTLLNHREKYFIREPASSHTARRMIGIPLPSADIAALLCGRGFAPERYTQILPSELQDGWVSLELWHDTEAVRAEARIDNRGRLRTIIFTDAVGEEQFMRADYLEFRHDSATGIVWPNVIHLRLLDRGEQLQLRGLSVDINNRRLLSRLDRSFVKRERGPRVRLGDIPPGAPVLYRNLKIYVEEDAEK